MTSDQIGKLLVLAGALILVVGMALLLLGRTPLGRLPGDITVRSGNISCFVPLATMLIISLLLTILINVALRLFDR